MQKGLLLLRGLRLLAPNRGGGLPHYFSGSYAPKSKSKVKYDGRV